MDHLDSHTIFLKQIAIGPKLSILGSMFTREELGKKFKGILIQIINMLKTKHFIFKIIKQYIPSWEWFATTLALPFLYFIRYENCSRNSNKLACLLINLHCPFKCFRDLWSLWMTNSLAKFVVPSPRNMTPYHMQINEGNPLLNFFYNKESGDVPAKNKSILILVHHIQFKNI